jgi:hypothetical protein
MNRTGGDQSDSGPHYKNDSPAKRLISVRQQ